MFDSDKLSRESTDKVSRGSTIEMEDSAPRDVSPRTRRSTATTQTPKTAGMNGDRHCPSAFTRGFPAHRGIDVDLDRPRHCTGQEQIASAPHVRGSTAHWIRLLNELERRDPKSPPRFFGDPQVDD